MLEDKKERLWMERETCKSWHHQYFFGGFCDSIHDTDCKYPLCVAEDFMKLRLESLLYRDVCMENYFSGFKHTWSHVYSQGRGI